MNEKVSNERKTHSFRARQASNIVSTVSSKAIDTFKNKFTFFQNKIDIRITNGAVFATEDLVGTEAQCVQQVLLGHLLLLVLQPALLHHHRIQLELLLGALDDLHLNGLVGDQTEHLDGLLLTDTVCTILRLQIRLWVPKMKVKRKNWTGKIGEKIRTAVKNKTKSAAHADN